MKTIEEIIENYSEYGTFLDDRFGIRFVSFLTERQGEKIGFTLKEGHEWETPKEWTRENILAQLQKDVAFGMAKAKNQRGISSDLMYHVVRSWNKVLEEGLESFDDYGSYGMPLFKATANKYGWL